MRDVCTQFENLCMESAEGAEAFLHAIMGARCPSEGEVILLHEDGATTAGWTSNQGIYCSTDILSLSLPFPIEAPTKGEGPLQHADCIGTTLGGCPANEITNVGSAGLVHGPWYVPPVLPCISTGVSKRQRGEC